MYVCICTGTYLVVGDRLAELLAFLGVGQRDLKTLLGSTYTTGRRRSSSRGSEGGP